MFLCISFIGEAIPFILDNATEAECLQAIEVAKKDFKLSKDSARIDGNHIYLEATPKHRPKKRLYCLNEKVILVTDTDCPGEIQPTKELLAIERNVSPSDIYMVEY